MNDKELDFREGYEVGKKEGIEIARKEFIEWLKYRFTQPNLFTDEVTSKIVNAKIESLQEEYKMTEKLKFMCTCEEEGICSHNPKKTNTKIIKMDSGKLLEIETKLREKVRKKDIKIPKGWRLLTLSECVMILEGHSDFGLGHSYEWISYKNSVSVLGGCSGVRLGVGGYWSGSGDGGFAVGVRFCREAQSPKTKPLSDEEIRSSESKDKTLDNDNQEVKE